MKNKKEVKNICHLIGFRLISSTEIQIDDRFRIRELLPVELKSLESIYEQAIQYYHHEWKSRRFCIESIEEIDLWKLALELDKIIISMWLFSGHSITKGALLREPHLKSEPYCILDSVMCEQGLGVWQVTNSEIKKFNDFWNNVKNIDFNMKNDIAIRYFKKALNSVGNTDSLVNLTIAMERILLPKENRELRDKFSLRAAFILAEKFEVRQQIKDVFKKAYDIRSKIVHGWSPKIDEKNFTIYLYLCRKIICIYLENKYKWQNLLLDELTLGNNKLTYNLVKYLGDLRDKSAFFKLNEK